MTSPQDITALMQGYTDLKAYYEGRRAQAEAELSEVASRFGNVFSPVYVDQTTGQAGAPGTRDRPCATIQEAIDLTPPRAICQIYLRGPYTTTQRYRTFGRYVMIIGSAGPEWVTATTETRPAITVGVRNNQGVAEVCGFSPEFGSHVNITHCRVTLPSTAAVQAALPGAILTDQSQRAFISSSVSAALPRGGLTMRFGELIVPGDYYGTLFSTHPQAVLNIYDLAITGSLAGKILPSVSAGTTQAQAAHLIQTNITTL